jgi:hypothetical protein
MSKATATTKATKATKRPASKKAKTTLPKTTSSRNGHRKATPMGVMSEETKRLTLRAFRLAYEQHQREKQNAESDV